MASTYLTRTPASAGSRTTWTFSAWVKRANTSSTGHQIFDCSPTPGTDESKIYFYNDFLYWKQEIGGGGADGYLVTNRKFRDTNAWYHIVCQWNTTNATASERMKIWINGVQETSFSTNNSPDQNRESFINSSNAHYLGSAQTSGSFFDGSMTHVHFIDGTAYAASDFGETDATTGIWKPKTAPSVTYGTNGFFLKFENSGSMGTDSSGNANNFTVNGTMTQTVDTPSNVFATMNPLASQSGSSSSSSAFTFSNGNLSVSNITSETGIANLGVSTGKWFWEVKVVTDQAGLTIGACNDGQNLDDELGYQSGSSQSNAKCFGYYGDNGYKFSTIGDGSQMSAYGSAIAVNDIVGVAMNLDDNQVTFYLNGSSQGTFSITALGSGEVYFPAVGNWSVSTIAVDFNFGNGYFGTSPVSSAQNPDDGIGIFEYDVPTGYRALCTKSINAQEYS